MRYTVHGPALLGDVLDRLVAGASRRTRKQMLAGDRVRVNGVPARRGDTWLATGDVVEVGASAPRVGLPTAVRLVYEDADVVVVSKPAGLLTIATERERRRTLYAYL